MTTAVVISIIVPIVASALFLAARSRLPKPAADARGIALQTVIVIVVMLVIAGAVAGILLNRASTEIERLDDVDAQACALRGGSLGDDPGTATTETDFCIVP